MQYEKPAMPDATILAACISAISGIGAAYLTYRQLRFEAQSKERTSNKSDTAQVAIARIQAEGDVWDWVERQGTEIKDLHSALHTANVREAALQGELNSLLARLEATERELADIKAALEAAGFAVHRMAIERRTADAPPYTGPEKRQG